MGRTLAILMLLVMAPLSAAQGGIRGYKGSDAGHVLLSASIAPAPTWFIFKYRALDGRGKADFFAQPWNGFVKYERIVQSAPLTPLPADLAAAGLAYGSNELLGYTLTARLAPGKYEIYRIEAAAYGNGQSVGADVSIPFEVRPGRVTYLGAFAAYPLGRMEKSWLMGPQPVLSAFRVVVTDAHERDARLARAEDPKLGNVDVSLAEGAYLMPFPTLRLDAPAAQPAEDRAHRDQ